MSAIYTFSDEDLDFHYSRDDRPNKRDFEMHTHEYCELYIFLAGKGIFKIEGNEYPLSAGDILVLKPFESHFIDIDESQPYERIAIHFLKDLLLSFDPTGELTGPILNHRSGHDNLFRASDFSSDIYQTVLWNLRQPNDNSRMKIFSHLMMILYEICHRYFDTVSSEADIAKETLSHQIVNYIMQHIEEPLTLDHICKKFYISKSKLCKIFQESTGSTVQNYIATKKMSHAKWLLSIGMRPTDVAPMCGFSDYSNFYRTFMKHYGISPLKEFKKENKNAPSY